MKACLAAWRNVQDTIVRHPFCRYTILPAGIVLAIWLIAVPAMAWNWWQEGLPFNLANLSDDYMVRLDQDCIYSWILVSIGLMGLILTGRWFPTLVALTYMVWPMAVYDQSGSIGRLSGTNLVVSILWLMALAPIIVWMRVMDRRLEPISENSPPKFWFSAQPLDPQMRKLCWGAAGFCLLQIPMLLLAQSCWIQNGMLQTLWAGILFAIIVDITWRISPDLTRLLRALFFGIWGFVLLLLLFKLFRSL